MARFCGTCGTALQESSAFCGACGARVQPASAPFTPQPVAPLPPASPVPAAYPVLAVKTGSSPVLKIILAVVVLLVVVGAISLAGILYAVHLAAHKAHEFSRQVRDSGILAALPADRESSSGSVGSAGIAGPGACRLLSKDEVGRAIGVAIVATNTTENGCEYLAQGTAGDMTAKHLSAMMASKGANAQAQQMIQNLSRGVLSAQSQMDGQSTSVNSVVMAFTIDPNSARTQMTLNENVLGRLGPPSKPLSGIGDEAFDTAGAVMMVRKGDKLIRITYSTCPCTIEAIKPLARRLVASL